MTRTWTLILGGLIGAALAACTEVRSAMDEISTTVDREFERLTDGSDESASGDQEDGTTSDAERDYRLGLRHLNGEGVPKDLDKSAQLLLAAAEQGHADAQYMVGVVFGLPSGPKHDAALSAAWLERAADQGHARAQFSLADAFANGRGVKPEAAWAAMWYRRAALQGHDEAQYRLAMLEIAGRGSPRDWEDAGLWLNLAAKAGHEDAARRWQALAPRLGAARRAKVEAAVDAFRPAPTGALPDPPLLRFVQYALAKLGHDPGSIDGLAGPRTRRAIIAYGATRSRRSDGTVTPALVTSLRAELRARAKPRA